MGIAIGPNPLHLDQALSLCFEELPDSDAQELLPVRILTFRKIPPLSRNEHRRPIYAILHARQ